MSARSENDIAPPSVARAPCTSSPRRVASFVILLSSPSSPVESLTRHEYLPPSGERFDFCWSNVRLTSHDARDDDGRRTSDDEGQRVRCAFYSHTRTHARARACLFDQSVRTEETTRERCRWRMQPTRGRRTQQLTRVRMMRHREDVRRGRLVSRDWGNHR